MGASAASHGFCLLLFLNVPLLYVNACVGLFVSPDVAKYLPDIASYRRYFLRFEVGLFIASQIDARVTAPSVSLTQAMAMWKGTMGSTLRKREKDQHMY